LIYEIQTPNKATEAGVLKTEFTASNDYRHIILGGVEYHLGDVQASIVLQLHDASNSRNHWVHGIFLVEQIHAQSGCVMYSKAKMNGRKLLFKMGEVVIA
jgi:hypothetical protein